MYLVTADNSTSLVVGWLDYVLSKWRPIESDHGDQVTVMHQRHIFMFSFFSVIN